MQNEELMEKFHEDGGRLSFIYFAMFVFTVDKNDIIICAIAMPCFIKIAEAYPA